MKLVCVLWIAALAGCCQCGTKHGAWAEDVRCTRVIDGDTIQIEGGYRVRLVGVDAFELVRGQRLNSEARAAGITPEEALRRGHQQAEQLRRRIEGKTVRLGFRLYPTDRYGRMLATLVTKYGERE